MVCGRAHWRHRANTAERLRAVGIRVVRGDAACSQNTVGSRVFLVAVYPVHHTAQCPASSVAGSVTVQMRTPAAVAAAAAGGGGRRFVGAERVK